MSSAEIELCRRTVAIHLYNALESAWRVWMQWFGCLHKNSKPGALGWCMLQLIAGGDYPLMKVCSGGWSGTLPVVINVRIR
ncbi:MAG: hypothetical protein OXD42_08905 [Rhodospirillaceae bacterium]|nr:hypothetical protein [Rhodospirillaceae bacterium]MCY4239312.1 hypothetical protein [Rhodospirillaceae bacterium]